MENYLDSFNPPQREAVEFCDGPSLVIAGAGSGKTRVLTYKIAYLMQQGYEPWSILALTFTNKAANEMKERIAKIVGEDMARRLWMGTFHSVFLRILRMENEYIGFTKNFTIYDTADSKSLIKSIIKEMGLDDKTYRPGDVLGAISKCKNQLVTAEQYVDNPANAQSDARRNMPALGQIFVRYANRCKQSDAMDFDDILLYTYLLLANNPKVRELWESRFKYVLVDEYQDTNFAQHQIVWLLTEHRQRVCVVGDDAQSIYSFRGANIDNILTFMDRYDNARMYKLEQNYRSTQNIVEAANSLIKKNRRQIHKDVFSEKDRGELLHVCKTHSDIEESRVVVNNIRRIKQRDDCSYSDFAILYRTNAQSRVFEDTLRKEGMPYRIFGGLSFYLRKEIKDIIAYFRMAVNPNDGEALRRVINYPMRGIGATTVAKIAQQAYINNVSLWTVISFPMEYELSLAKSTAAKVQQFHDMIERFVELAQTMPADEVGKLIMKESGIVADIYQDSTPEGRSRQENVEEMMNGMQDFCDSRREEGNSNIFLTDYLSEVSLISDIDSDKGDDEHKITLMTVHSAKGLEFSNVFVAGLEEGLFPSMMASGSPREMEEERRLFYVAITRAKTRCFLTYAECRFRYGKMEFENPSRFLADIDGRYLDHNQTIMSTQKKMTDDVELPWKRPFRPTPPQTERTINVNMTRFSRIESTPSSKPAESHERVGNLAVGKHIEHQRFGRGQVLKIEGKDDGMKATIQFENVGTKQLLLKFAKITIID